MSDGLVLADPDRIEIEFPALRISQPIGDIYMVKMSYRDVRRLTYFDVRRVLRDERDVERYLGVQRPLSEVRVKELRKFVGFVDASFPTSIILAASDDYVDFDEEKSRIKCRNYKVDEDKPSIALANLCRVLDGQHRIEGLEGFKPNGEVKDFDVIVSLFVGMDIADQAYVFATVNLEQTKVNKSLAYDLFELSRTRSPVKTSHNIAIALDLSKGGPFFHRIKRLGLATPGRTGETITQATFVNGILRYISDDPKRDRDLLLRGGRLQPVDGLANQRFCLRNLFIHERDLDIARLIENYFAAVRDRWPDAWNDRGQGNVLARTNGFRALVSIFGRAYNFLGVPGEAIPTERFKKLFNKVAVDDSWFTTENIKPGTSGETTLRQRLVDQMF